MMTFTLAAVAALALAGPSGDWEIKKVGTATRLYTADGPAAFQCQKGALRAIISLEGDVEKGLRRPLKRVKALEATVQVGDQVEAGSVGYYKNAKLVAPTTERAARILFNAAIRGDDAELASPSLEAVSIVWPEADTQKFREFARACEL